MLNVLYIQLILYDILCHNDYHRSCLGFSILNEHFWSFVNFLKARRNAFSLFDSNADVVKPDGQIFFQMHISHVSFIKCVSVSFLITDLFQQQLRLQLGFLQLEDFHLAGFLEWCLLLLLSDIFLQKLLCFDNLIRTHIAPLIFKNLLIYYIWGHYSLLSDDFDPIFP